MKKKVVFLSKPEVKAIKDLKKALEKEFSVADIVLFGSKAKGQSDKESDIDILIVLNMLTWPVEKKVYELCFDIGLKYDCVFSPAVVSNSEIKSPIAKIIPFYKNIKREGVRV